MKNIFLFFAFISLCNVSYAQKKIQNDIWSGSYVINSVNNKSLKTSDTLVIAKTADADPKEIAARYESDLLRWMMTSTKGGDKEEKIIRRFLFDPENKNDGYEEFDWTDLHKTGKMNCIDGGHFFICQTEPNTEVKFGKEEKIITKTGVFGVWLHYGLVELQKIK